MVENNQKNKLLRTPMAVSIINSSWDTATAMGLHVVYGCFHSVSAELASGGRDHMASKVKNIYYLAFQVY
jgi:hypothetical protein